MSGQRAYDRLVLKSRSGTEMRMSETEREYTGDLGVEGRLAACGRGPVIADRLCGPARLCLRAGGRPEAIARAIRAGFDFTHDDPGTAWVQALVKDEGLERAVRMVCALEETDDLYRMIMNSQND